MNIPTSISTIFSQIVNNEFFITGSNLSIKLENINKDYEKVINIINNEKNKERKLTDFEFRKTLRSTISGKNTIFNNFRTLKKKFKENTGKILRINNLSYDLSDISNKKLYNALCNSEEKIKENIEINQPKFKQRAPSIKNKSTRMRINSSPKIVNSNEFNNKQESQALRMYTNKEGFIKFVNELFSSKESLDIGYHNEILKIISEHSQNNLETVKLVESDFSKIEETEHENECDYFSSNSQRWSNINQRLSKIYLNM
jgi:hypothetical protein